MLFRALYSYRTIFDRRLRTRSRPDPLHLSFFLDRSFSLRRLTGYECSVYGDIVVYTVGDGGSRENIFFGQWASRGRMG